MARREAFDPLQNYVANRTFAFGAKTYNDGDPFNERSDMRRMRQLYDGRYLRMAPKRTDMPNFKGMREEQLKEWLIDNGYPTLAHPRSPHVRLVERAQRVWAEQQAAKLAKPAMSNGNGKSKDSSNGVAAGELRSQTGRERLQGPAIKRRSLARNTGQRERL